MPNYAEILIVDDVPEQITFAGALLREEGYRVFVLTNGTAAIKFLENRRPDLIMLDIKMEHIDGLEVCKRIKQNPATKNIPIIFLTAQTKPETIKRCFELGGCDYVVKPFIREEFLSRVKAQLANSRQRKALDVANKELRMFCNAVSQDLRSPIDTVNAMLTMLKDELKLSEYCNAYELMNMIGEKTGKLALMLRRLAEFSDMCNIDPHITPMDLAELFRVTFGELKSLEPDRTVEFLCDDMPQIPCDPSMAKMLVRNLLSNALKFTGHSRAPVIAAEYHEEKDCHVITVRDNGAGFDASRSDELFGIFRRLHSDDEFEGAGVGLALCDRIMKHHGGYIKADGAINSGAAFSLYFPKNQEG